MNVAQLQSQCSAQNRMTPAVSVQANLRQQVKPQRGGRNQNQNK